MVLLTYRFRIYVQQQPSTNLNVTTYEESMKVTANFPQYAALESVIEQVSRWFSYRRPGL